MWKWTERQKETDLAEVKLPKIMLQEVAKDKQKQPSTTHQLTRSLET